MARKHVERRWFFRAARRYTDLLGVETDGLRFLVDLADRQIGGRLFERGERMEFRRLAATVRRVPARGTFVDVGANIGTTCLPALAWHGFDRAVAIEPHPRNARLLRAAAALNGFEDRITVVEAAATEASGTARLREHPVNSGGHAVDDSGEMEVRTVQLDDVVSPEDVGLVWIDVEGSERRVLAGASRLLAAGVPFVCEIGRDDDLSDVFDGWDRFSLRGQGKPRRGWDDVLFTAAPPPERSSVRPQE